MFPEILSLDEEELQQLKKLNEETIATLESDIKLLQWQLKQFGPSAELSIESLKRRSFEPADSQVLLERLQQEISTMNTRLHQINHLTGITIEKISRQVLELDETHSKTHFDLVLKVMGNVMYLKYEIDELRTEDKDGVVKGGRVTWMEIQIDRETNKVIGNALTKSIEEVSIQSALCLIKSYLKFVADRESLIQHFLLAYPTCVSHVVKDNTHCLLISDHDHSTPVFSIEWNFEYKSNNYAIPQVKLEVKASRKLKDMDDKGVLDSAPDMFMALKSDKGLKAAIDCIIQLVTMDTDKGSEMETLT